MIRAYVLGNLMLGLALAGLQGGLFAALGLDNAAGLGVVTGFLNVVPVLGLPLALLLPLLQGLGSFARPWPFAVLGLALTALHLIASNWIVPRTIGLRIKVNASAGTVGLLFFGWIWGVTGFLLAVPLTAALKIALECSPRSRRWAGLIGAS